MESGQVEDIARASHVEWRAKGVWWAGEVKQTGRGKEEVSA